MLKSQITRLILFGLIVGGAIYWFASMQSKAGSAGVKGEQTQKMSDLRKEIESNLSPIVGQQVQKLKKELLPYSKEVIEDTELAQEIEKEVDRAMENVKGFSKEQKKEIKKQIIQQIADQLIKQIEEDE